ncbi:sodium/potassium-transporting ATPase subunit beta-1 [Drosophila eugracilis]|uniref:sodium/potassium-transporting ATPase subunit beta-1 n=1 Tax=Drosophila eugracilis TaxID=29029 RepID=UPI001BDA0A21|nr:sodium/potassium-transporting ATPase subunit beta-1 [Drosophila eugracilis]
MMNRKLLQNHKSNWLQKKQRGFPITETFSDIPGEEQSLKENQKVKVGKRNKKIRIIGINTDISRRPNKTVISTKLDLGIYHDDGRLRDIGQNTDKIIKPAKKYKYKIEPDDNPIDIGPSNDQTREIGVNTKILPKGRPSHISEMVIHKGGQSRDVGSNTERPFKPVDDGTKVIFMKPIKSDRKKLNRLIVDPPLDNGPYKIPTKEEGRTYYKGYEYHFPGRTGWRRLFYSNTNGKYELRKPSQLIYTLIFAILYIIFVMIFSLAWFDYVTCDISRRAPLAKMFQPYLTFSPVGPRTNPHAISYDPKNDAEIMEKYAAIMALLEKYGDSGHNARFGSCTAGDQFGYPSGEPCVFLKVNRLIGFKTEPYTDSDDLINAKIDEEDFTALKSLLNKTKSEEDRQNRTWITCQTKDQKNIKIEFHPEPAIRTEYTDITEKIEHIGAEGKRLFFGPNDLNRIVALKIKNLRPNERVNVNCKMWARNIIHNQQGYGQVAFYVLLATENNRERVERVLRHHDLL